MLKFFLAIVFVLFFTGCSAKERLDIEFINDSCIKPLIDYHYLTCNDIEFKVNGITFIVPKGFETDLASIPKIAWPIIAPFHSSLIRSAIIHDWLYKSNCFFTRKQSDVIFYHLLINDDVSHVKAGLIYFAVRWFGWNYYNANYCEKGIDNMNKETQGAQIAFIRRIDA